MAARDDMAAYMRARRARQEASGGAPPKISTKTQPARARPLDKGLRQGELSTIAQPRAPRSLVVDGDRPAGRTAPTTVQPSRSADSGRKPALDPIGGGQLVVYAPPPRPPSMTAGRSVKPAPKRAQGMVASGGTPPGPPLNIEITPWQLGELLRTRRADQAEIDALKRRADMAERRNAELEQAEAARRARSMLEWRSLASSTSLPARRGRTTGRAGGKVRPTGGAHPLEAAADRRAGALDFANALVGLFRFGLTGRAS